ncbi:LOW QUALITY PROTEIN: hypothetical protein CVT25_001254 [Psilocybe cyanescens]|uniref:Uncharacterized protein n=1 Tax=Psilocybe cyanescens TaxID=93625 RepID=A0A409XAW6_PSICY|nr:LOW QUALITY PROTEIN: hypothetical protein CVT25_001254 [Psilocybe cyanescens]
MFARAGGAWGAVVGTGVGGVRGADGEGSGSESGTSAGTRAGSRADAHKERDKDVQGTTGGMNAATSELQDLKTRVRQFGSGVLREAVEEMRWLGGPVVQESGRQENEMTRQRDVHVDLDKVTSTRIMKEEQQAYAADGGRGRLTSPLGIPVIGPGPGPGPGEEEEHEREISFTRGNANVDTNTNTNTNALISTGSSDMAVSISISSDADSIPILIPAPHPALVPVHVHVQDVPNIMDGDDNEDGDGNGEMSMDPVTPLMPTSVIPISVHDSERLEVEEEGGGGDGGGVHLRLSLDEGQGRSRNQDYLNDEGDRQDEYEQEQEESGDNDDDDYDENQQDRDVMMGSPFVMPPAVLLLLEQSVGMGAQEGAARKQQNAEAGPAPMLAPYAVQSPAPVPAQMSAQVPVARLVELALPPFMVSSSSPSSLPALPLSPTPTRDCTRASPRTSSTAPQSPPPASARAATTLSRSALPSPSVLDFDLDPYGPAIDSDDFDPLDDSEDDNPDRDGHDANPTAIVMTSIAKGNCSRRSTSGSSRGSRSCMRALSASMFEAGAEAG